MAMNKSMRDSDGTVLSTDWGDVKGRDYRGKDMVSPGEGQERKLWK